MYRTRGEFRSRPRPSWSDLSDLDALASNSHRPEAQRVIREGIRRGVIRVAPIPGCRHHVRIYRCAADEPAPPRRPLDEAFGVTEAPVHG